MSAIHIVLILLLNPIIIKYPNWIPKSKIISQFFNLKSFLICLKNQFLTCNNHTNR